MSSIKFRRWDFYNNTMEYNPITYAESDGWDDDTIIVNKIFEERPQDTPIIKYYRYDWQQFTGLLDKNGKEIYEGDFLEKNSKFYVAYCTGMNDGLGMIAGWYLQRDDFESWIPLQYNDYYEVCGNIYENSELLNNE